MTRLARAGKWGCLGVSPQETAGALGRCVRESGKPDSRSRKRSIWGMRRENKQVKGRRSLVVSFEASFYLLARLLFC